MASVRPITLSYNRVYLFEDGGERVLVDAGPDYHGAWDELQDALGGRKPGTVVATHGHHDHAGLGAAWQGEGADVLLHPADWRMVSGEALSDAAEWGVYRRYVENCGAPREATDSALAFLAERRAWARRSASQGAHPPARPNTRWPTGLRCIPFEPAWDGQDLPGQLEIIEAPGHTPGNLVLACGTEGWLFSGDHLLPEIAPTPGIAAQPCDGGWHRFQSLVAYEHSMQVLATREWSRCFPGHGEPFDNVGERISAALSQIEERAQRVLDVVRQRDGSTTYQVAAAIYPRALKSRFWQIMGTVQGHLDLLLDRGEMVAGEAGYSLR